MDQRAQPVDCAAMRDASDIAALASLLAEPARARMLTALMSGIALTATELSLEADIAPSTASAHLAKLTDAKILSIEKQGRHRYFRLVDEEIAEMLESLMSVATRKTLTRRVGPTDPALRSARVCYDHLAGERGVWLLDALRTRQLLRGRDAYEVTPSGDEFFRKFGIDTAELLGNRRPLCRSCLDWSERRHHLGGSLGAAILQRIFTLKWGRRDLDSRAVIFTPRGEAELRRVFGEAVVS